MFFFKQCLLIFVFFIQLFPLNALVLDEVKEKSKELTYDLDWKKKDLIMLDNMRFTHGRRAFKKSDKRDIMTVESSSANFGYGSTTRTKLN